MLTLSLHARRFPLIQLMYITDPLWSNSDQPLTILLLSYLPVQLWRLFCVKHAITAIAERLAAHPMVAVPAPSVLAVELAVLECDHLAPSETERGHRALHIRMGITMQEATF